MSYHSYFKNMNSIVTLIWPLNITRCIRSTWLGFKYTCMCAWLLQTCTPSTRKCLHHSSEQAQTTCKQHPHPQVDVSQPKTTWRWNANGHGQGKYYYASRVYPRTIGKHSEDTQANSCDYSSLGELAMIMVFPSTSQSEILKQVP